MTAAFILRRSAPDDFDTLGAIMFRAIREGDSPYTQAQRVAWMPQQNCGAVWAARLAEQVVVLGSQGDTPVGFMTLVGEGYIDFAYILPEARGQGLFAFLLDEIETCATHDGLTRLWTHASLMAQPAFARNGFSVVRHETIARAGQSLRRAEMEKSL